jgi:tRNA uridine 5-carboxymethylaminomethyl modification enzyme
MFTSRAEYRLQLREDNADLRLTEAGRHLGLVDDRRWDAFNRKRDAIAREQERLRLHYLGPRNLASDHAEALFGQTLEREYSLADLLKRPGVSYAGLINAAALGAPVTEDAVVAQIEIQAKYQGYIDRQRDEVARQSREEDTRLPSDIDYRTVRGLSFEVQQKLNQHRPETLGQASRISGITPAAIALLLVHLKRGLNRPVAAEGS